MPAKWNPSEKQSHRIIAGYLRGRSIKELARNHGTSKSVLYRHFKECQVSMRAAGTLSKVAMIGDKVISLYLSGMPNTSRIQLAAPTQSVP